MRENELRREVWKKEGGGGGGGGGLGYILRGKVLGKMEEEELL